MSQEPRDHRKVIFGEKARAALLKGAKEMARTVGLSYGPRGKNVLIEKNFGRPMSTRDGVTISKEVYSKVRDENMGMQLLNEAAEATVKNVGDGTTATIVLTYNLIKQGYLKIAAGVNPMEVKDLIIKDSYKLLDKVSELSQPVKKGQLKQVAAVSSGDEALGQLIAEAVEEVGADGGIITQRAPIADVDRTYVEGYYTQQGFSAIESGKLEISETYIVVSAKTISTGPEVIKLVNKVAQQALVDKGLPPGSQLTEPLSICFFGEFEGLAHDTILANLQKGIFTGCVIKSPPQGGDMTAQYLDDLAIYTGAQMITKGDRLDDLTSEFVGKAERVRCTNAETTVFGGEGTQEDIDKRKEELRDRIAKEEVDAITDKLKERLSKLEGKIAIFRIGGANETEREEKEFRIDDSIQATKAAAASGIVAGAGTTLLELARCDVDKVWSKALRSTYKKLLTNAALPAEVKMNAADEAGYPQGYNLRKSAELVDVIAEGVVDPTEVVENIIRNAASTAGSAVISGALITFVDHEEKK